MLGSPCTLRLDGFVDREQSRVTSSGLGSPETWGHSACGSRADKADRGPNQ